MKKIKNSILTTLSISVFAIAGGDLPSAVQIAMAEGASGLGNFYVGAGISNLTNKTIYWYESTTYHDEGKKNALKTQYMLQAGYQYNRYFALEGRYWFGSNKRSIMDDDAYNLVNNNWVYNASYVNGFDAKILAYGIYAKPILPLTKRFNLYGLMGYGKTKVIGTYYFDIDTGWHDMELYSKSKSGFQWGTGTSYDITDNISVFADYVKLNKIISYSDGYGWYETIVSNPYTINLGITYKF